MAGLLRLITCGSVDDGKSTLIGRLLHDGGRLPADVLDTLAADSRRAGLPEGEIDLSLLVDGLEAEREQGITIDVAYRQFATDRRRYLIADTPGHEQYTRNMVTGASNADAAILLVDARKGLLPQTRRHSLLAHLLGIRHVILTVTKMDLVDFDQAVFEAIAADYRIFAAAAGIAGWQAVPLSAKSGAMVVARGAAMDWYAGPTLVEVLDGLPDDGDALAGRPMRLPVQAVIRAGQEYRGFAGSIASGRIAPGDAVRLVQSGRTTRIAEVRIGQDTVTHAVAGQSVAVTLTDAVDCARGEVIAAAEDAPQAADQFEATLAWLGDEPLIPGRAYWLKCGTQTVSATVQAPKYEIAIDTLEHLAAPSLAMNAIGVVELATDRDIVFEPYASESGPPNRALGGFILIDKLNGATVAAGMIHFALRRSANLHRQPIDVSRTTRARLLGQRPAVVWLTGLSGAGKSTIANLVEKRLVAMGRHSFLLDGDNVRLGLNRDLGFTEADRIENIRRVGEVARLMSDAGLIVITAFISPYRAERAMARAMMADGEFIEVFVDTPLAEAEKRDVKGLYAKARAGELANFTGIDSAYEPPEAPDLTIDTMTMTPEAAAQAIVDLLLDR